MIFARGIAFLFFLLLALAMVVWQGNHLRLEMAEAFNPPALFAMMALGLGILATQAIVFRTMGKQPSLLLLALGGVLILPLTAIVGGVLSLIQFRSGNHRRIWTSVLAMGVLIGMNVALPLAVSTILVGGGSGLMTGWIAVKLQFFVVVDYFLGRAILYYFNSGASAFVSLRYLRRRVLSLLAVFGIGLGVLVLIVVNSVMTGFQTDFREQMRGSLSHLLVRIQSEDIRLRLDKDVLTQARWAEYVNRIESNDDMLPAWDAALKRALEAWRAADKDALPDPADFFEAQPPIPPNGDDNGEENSPAADDLAIDEKAFLQRLRTGIGLTEFERSCLTDTDGQQVTPKQFYLRRVGNPEEAEDEIKPSWYAPAFRAALQKQFKKAEAALNEHTNPQGEPDVEGVSWRVSTKTFITPKSGSRELPIAELVGVDPERETSISKLGEYVANAELSEFREQYVLTPMLNILGSTLGWETQESLDATDGEPLFLYTETGFMAKGRLPDDLTRYLAVRHFTTASGRVRWRTFDNVKYHEFTPGRQIYDRVREAYKSASRTEELDELGTILRACESDLRAILLEYIEDYPTEERFQKVNSTGAKIIYFEYLTGYAEAVETIQAHNRETVSLLRTVENPGDGRERSEAELEFLRALRGSLAELADVYTKKVQDLHLSEPEREKALADFGRQYRELLQGAIEEAGEREYPSTGMLEEVLITMRHPEDLLRLRNRMEMRLRVPMSYSAAYFGDNAEFVNKAMKAYRKVLPVRTTMKPGESPQSYFKRARAKREDGGLPGIILGDALAESSLGRPVHVGDQIAVTVPRIYYQDGRMIPDTTEVWFKVTGLFRSGLYEENAGRMYCDFDELAGILADSETRYIVGARLTDYKPYEGQVQSDKLKADVREALNRHGVRYLSVGVWEDETRTLLEAVNIERSLIGLIVSMIIVLAGGAIVIIVYQLVNEKVKDIGILKALGHSPWGIRSVFMFNALFIGLFGAIGGATLGIVASEYLNEIEDFIDEMTGIRLFPPDIYFLTYIPSVKGMELIWLAVDIAVPVVMFGFFCGILPSLAAARKDPVEALHYE